MSDQAILRLENEVQRYDWGSRTAIPALLGRPPSAEPQAELWMGAHPRAPSRVGTSEGEVALDAWIARDPDATLGRDVAARFGGALPFLFKVLAAERPLSIQAHPGREQARAGFEREERAGIPRDAAERRYPDPNEKPELICALTCFRALDRFREPAEIRERLERIGAGRLATRGDGAKALFAAWLAAGAAERADGIERATRWARDAADDDAAARCVLELAARHPGDAGVLAPLWLNLVELEPGEALFLPPGELHAYLGGVGLELMGSSDNVLRGGLTAKPVDVPELLVALADRAGPVERLTAEPLGPGESVYRTPAAAFELSVIDTRARGPRAFDHGVEVLLCSEGTCEISAGSAPPLALARGGSAFVPACAPPYRIDGEAILHRAALPR